MVCTLKLEPLFQGSRWGRETEGEGRYPSQKAHLEVKTSKTPSLRDAIRWGRVGAGPWSSPSGSATSGSLGVAQFRQVDLGGRGGRQALQVALAIAEHHGQLEFIAGLQFARRLIGTANSEHGLQMRH